MRAATCALLFVMLLAACGPGRSSTAPTGPGVPTTVPTSPVEGIVIDVDSRGLGDVRAFTLRTNDGRQLTFTVDRLENAVEFPPGHLTEHAIGAVPVRVTFVVDGSNLAATHLEDAG